MNVAIVVVAYTRPSALARLLNSIANASYDGFDSVPLIISIDGGGDPTVVSVAEQLPWQHGPKKVRPYRTNLGLKKHVLACGDLASEYDGIIMLEDDLMVSPAFYAYGKAALEAYHADKRIGGISLYSYRYLDINGFPFSPLVANGDIYLAKFPSSSGQAWTRGQWQSFRDWLKSGRDTESEDLDAQLPRRVSAWPDSSWKKSFARYLVDNNKYIAYPSRSLSTNMGNAGHHWRRNTAVFQVPLNCSPSVHVFPNPERAISYDQFFELENRSLDFMHCAEGLPRDIEFDLYGQKPFRLLNDKRVVSSKRSKCALPGFGLELLPHELNVIYGIQGDLFHVGEATDFEGSCCRSRTKLLEKHASFLGGRDMARLLRQRAFQKIRRYLS